MSKRYLHVFAEVRASQTVIEIPDGLEPSEVDELGADALDALLGNGDTGWNEIDETEAQKLRKAMSK